MAGLKLVEELVELCPGRYDIAMVGAEPQPAYNRVLLSSLLAGDAADGDIALRPAAWYAENGIELLTGSGASALRPGARAGDALDRRVARLRPARAGDRLDAPIRLPIPGRDLPGVITFRDLDDVAAMQRARPGTPVVVIGGGLLGVEAAYGLARRGCR